MVENHFTNTHTYGIGVRGLTLKAVDFTPLVWSLLKLTLSDMSLGGSAGSLVSLFSARVSSSRLASFEKAPSSISLMRFPVRSILFNVTGRKEEGGKKESLFSLGVH